MSTIAQAPFQLPKELFRSLHIPFADALRVGCERLLAFPVLNGIYARTQTMADATFCERVLHALDVRVLISEEDLKSIPNAGPLMVVANHPFGGIDGIILTALLQRVRPDVRLMANFLLASIPEMRETCLFVDPFGDRASVQRNRSSIKSALQWMVGGGALGLFPAGEVSHLTLKHRCVTDPPWSESVARLLLRSRATVVPVYFEGRNSPIFQLGGLIHPRIRTVMLPRELLKRRGQTVRVEIGTPIPPDRLARLMQNDAKDGSAARTDPGQVTEYLRLRTYILKGRSAADSATKRMRYAVVRTPEPVAPSVATSLLIGEVDALPVAQRLVKSGALHVYVASACQAPNILREIGRLRESTFRLVGEGTGRAVDLDQFDEHYQHLFIWNVDTRCVIGGYRLGQTDVLLPRFGAAGLYTSTLFRYQPRLLETLTPALELGRSFVIPECQRDYAPLSLLWKGIGRFVAANPKYRLLFGAVSISDEFQSMTKQLLMTFLRAHKLDGSLAALVQPKSPPRVRPFAHADAARLATLVGDVADVEELVSEIEHNRRGVPVLLRQYLKLNAKLLGFNIDSEFGDVIDGLVLIDLTKVDRPILNRYLGIDGAASFLAFQQALKEDTSRTHPN